MIIAIAILIAPAKATPVDVRFCIDYAMSITGASSTVGDDYYTSNDETYPAYGAHITVDEIGGSYLYTGYLATSGTYAGCTPALTLEYGTGLSAPKYSVIMRSENWIDGAWIKS